MSGGHRGDNQAFTGRSHSFMNCPSCGGRATVSNGRCTACGVATRSAKSDAVWTHAHDAAAATAAGLGSGAFADAVTGPGLFGDAPTGAGAGAGFSDASTAPTVNLDPDATRIGVSSESAAPADDSPAGPLSPGQPFGPRYHIVRLLGIGGMGAVYQAWDAELGVVVAVKVIRPEVAADPEAAAMLERRFKQELLLARQVTHKNVVRIYDLGEIDGIKFITMPFIEGEELAATIQRQDKLPIERVIKIARGIATGLEAAHAAGVVHRDLKPANIMVDKGDEAMIMDFGIARSTGGPNPVSPDIGAAFQTSARTVGQTMVGAVVGTVQYMAPEQARAEPVDQRADIYAFGLIVYDMLLHQQRARGAGTAIAELTSRMQSPPPAPRSIDPSIPEPLDRLVAQCIQPDATKRFQTTPQLVAALNRLDSRGKLLPVVRRLTGRLVAAVLAAFVAVLGLTWWFAQGPPVPVAYEPVSVLIARFPEQHRRSGVRSHAGADVQACAGRGWLHLGVRPEQNPSRVRHVATRETGRGGGSSIRDQPGPPCRSLRFDRPPGKRLRTFGQGQPGACWKRDCYGQRSSFEQRSGP